MRTARLVGPTADGTSVVLLTEDGEELTVPLDPDDPTTRSVLQQVRERLGAEDGIPTPDPAAAADEAPATAADGPPPAPAQARRPPRRRETPMDTTLSPRDIQTRIRAGESLEDLVAASGMDPERVERFAAPVLAEREHMALTALSGSVRRRGEGSGNRPLRTVVAERLLGQGVDADEVAWDAWKREDGQWQVSADYALLDQERHAEFRFDPQGRFSLAEDDDARWLSGERPSPVAAAVDRDDELALIRATSEPGHEVGHEDLREGAAHGPDASDADLDDDFHLDSDVEVTERLEVVTEGGSDEDLAAALQVVPPAELSLEELVVLATTDPESDLTGEDGDEARADEPDTTARTRDEAAEPTVAVVRHLTSVSVEVDVPDSPADAPDDAADLESVEDARSALDTLYDMLGGDGYAEDSVNVYAGLSDAAAVPVVDEHEFEAPTAVVVPADPGPDPLDGPAHDTHDTHELDVTVGAEVGEEDETDEADGTGPGAEQDAPEEHEAPAAPAVREQDGPTEPEDVALPGMEDEPTAAGPAAASTEASTEVTHDAAEAPPVPDVDEPLIPSPGASRKPGRRKRASVPSWDEIMFGGPKQS
ncbi:Protein of unknown function [Microlunatus sagamiharensis]|uniref:DUF3071 domain-containing protein n=1 Tax=Microlunatus sagamiharensis TaxID=546874 RepID=A0A1H2M089_9ACTN|nr:septation protein SepH [Microlunatus sagamiharensis]SDU86663.1 Protein of unknown function [Microlunatus sagamiharensis]